MGIRIAVDTGGTFTDVCAYDEQTGRVRVHKVSSTPDDPGRAIIQGVDEMLAEAGTDISQVSFFAHGTTVGTNALLTGNGARTGLITTRGFRDLLELGRGRRPSMYDPQADKPAPLIPRHLRLEVAERVRYTGEVEVPLDEDEVRRAVRALRDAGVHSIAVCLLYSFLAPAHERRIGEIIREEAPEVYVSLSSEVLPEFREYERLSTTVVNAYLGPVVNRYLRVLRERLAGKGLGTVPEVTQSNGGIIPFPTAERLPVRLVLSGPSTGVVGAARIASAAGYPDIITFDMGGTSSDISLVQEGQPKVTAGMELDGRPIRSPMLDIHTVGAGGGSIGWIDSGGHLRMGPQSAGAVPGPACYGKGEEPTVTDADVVLQILNPEYLLDGALRIDRSQAVAAVSRVGERLGMSPERTALGMLQVVTANMARAIRVVSVQRGYDPRDYALVPFGGAGPLHASRLARELGIRTVLVPETPGAQSALGLLMTEVKTDFMRTRITELDERAAGSLHDGFRDLETQADEWFEREGIAPDERRRLYRLELRYAGQNFELSVPVPDRATDAERIAAVIETFHEAHERMYGYRSPDAVVEAVTFRLQAVGRTHTVELHPSEPGSGDPSEARTGMRSTFLDGTDDYAPVPVYDRRRLLPGDRVAGPAIIEQMDTTVLLLPGDRCTVDRWRNLMISIGA
jgi:N-methylhydantoinase A